jgi:hypothetical protein
MAGDGWTVVVRSKGRKRARDSGGVATVSGGVAHAAAAAAAEGKKDQKYEDFYRFQQRDKRRSGGRRGAGAQRVCGLSPCTRRGRVGCRAGGGRG